MYNCLSADNTVDEKGLESLKAAVELLKEPSLWAVLKERAKYVRLAIRIASSCVLLSYSGVS